MKGWRYVRELVATSRAAKAQTGKPLLSQYREILALRRHKLGPQDYYDYRLFDDSRFSKAQKREFTGWRFQVGVYPSVNDPLLVARSGLPGSWGGCVDKILFDLLMRMASVPTARIVGIYDDAGVVYEGTTTCRTREDLERFVRSNTGREFFVKPARAHTGVGAMAVERVEDDWVLLADGRRLEFAAFLDAVTRHRRVLFQERLRPHPALRKSFGPTLGTLRIVALRRPARSRIHRTILRIPVGRNMVDNFDEGRTGNLVGWVDPDTGEVLRAYGGIGLSQKRVARHPDTGESLDGLRLPDWKEALDITDRASRALAGMPFQSWDLALTDRGPVMIEVNDVSAQDVLQLAGPPGLLDHELCQFLGELGFRWPDPHH